jgi:hypothetical protein
MVEVVLNRQAFARRGRQLEYFTIAWNTCEGLVAVISGAMAGSVSLVGFGIDSFIEVTSGKAGQRRGGWVLPAVGRFAEQT